MRILTTTALSLTTGNAAAQTYGIDGIFSLIMELGKRAPRYGPGFSAQSGFLTHVERELRETIAGDRPRGTVRPMRTSARNGLTAPKGN